MSKQLVISGINKKFGKKTILSDVSLTFDTNKIYGLLGRNGVGKSTLLNIINDKLIAETGEVTLDTQIINQRDDLLGQLFLVNDTLLLTKIDNLKVKKALKLLGEFYPDFDHNLAHHLLSEFDLPLNNQLKKLSTGYRSIFNIVMALCVPVDFIFLDEPILGLDANHREVFYRELLNTYSERPRTFVISTHLIEEVASIIEEVKILADEKIILEESTESLLSRSFTLSGEKNRLLAAIKGLNVLNFEELGGQGTAYILNDETDLPSFSSELTQGRLNLQDLFIQLTKKLGGVNNDT